MAIDIFCRPTGFLKIIELAIAFVCIALVNSYALSFGIGQHRFIVGVTTIGGMILVTLPLLIAHLFSDMIHKTVLEVLDNFIGFIMFAATGGLVIEFYHERDFDEEKYNAGLALGSLCIINAIVYFLDFIIAVRNRKA